MTLPKKGLSPKEASGREAAQFLVTLLKEEADAVKSLVQVAEKMREAILAQDHTQIEKAVAGETKLLEQIQSLEDRRSTWLDEWASTCSISKGDPTGADAAHAGSDHQLSLRDVLGLFSARDGRMVRKVADALTEQVQELDEINRQNAGLLFHSLAYVSNLLGALTQTGPETNVYGPGSSQQGKKTKSIVEWRA